MDNDLKIDELNDLIEFHEESIERIYVYVPSKHAEKLIKEIQADIRSLKREIKLLEKKEDRILNILIKKATESKDPYISPSLVKDIHNAVKQEFPNSKSTLKNLESERKMEQEVKKVIEEYITKNDK
jgi:uncharacterized protein YdhG (YjbR/CyaY superfamily)